MPHLCSPLALQHHARPAGPYGAGGSGAHGLYLPSAGWAYYSWIAATSPKVVLDSWSLFCMASSPCGLTYRLNGQLLGTAAATTGAFNGLGINAGGLYPSESSALALGDVMIWNRGLATAELERVEGYMAWTYNLASTTALVAGHPFKAARPLVYPGVAAVSASVTPGVTTFIGVANQSAAILRTVAGTGTAGARAFEDGSPALYAQVKPWRLSFDSWRNRLLFSDRVRAQSHAFMRLRWQAASFPACAASAHASPRLLSLRLLWRPFPPLPQDNHVIRAIDIASGRISTIAGATGLAGYVDSAMPLLEARFNAPRGLAVAPDGTILVCDYSCVPDSSAEGKPWTPRIDAPRLCSTAVPHICPPAHPQSPPALSHPCSNHAIRAIWPNSTVTTLSGAGAGFRDGVARTAQLNAPEDIAYDGSDPAVPLNFVLADGGNHRVRRLFRNASGFWLVTIGGTGGTTWAGVGLSTSTVMSGPTAVAVSPSGEVFASVSTGAYILRINGSTAASPPISATVGIVVGTGTSSTTGDGSECPTTRTSYGLAVSPDGSLIWSEYDAHGVRILLGTTPSAISVSGWNSTVMRLAGTYAATPYNDALPANRINLNNPAGLAIDNQGGMYIADYTCVLAVLRSVGRAVSTAAT